MASPFPGMDPYLEAPEFWHDVHVMLIARLSEVLNAQLPEGFAAHIERRVYISRPDSFAPDVAVTTFSTARNLPQPSGESVATLAVAEPTTAKRLVVPTLTVELPRLEIVTTRGRRQVVTAIEVLSPVNKRGAGREQYIEKQQELLRSETHLLEIDLLRGGEHTVAAPQDLLEEETEWDYLVCLHQAGESDFLYWDIRVRDPLPVISIPLTQPHPSVDFDLQAAFTHIYDTGPFRRELDYTSEPTPRLKGVDATWADALLREKNLRP